MIHQYVLSFYIYYNTSIFTQLFKKYKDTGEDTYFDLQLSNIDPTSDAGEHRIILKDCNLDGGQIVAFDAAGDWLEQELDFTFEDFTLEGYDPHPHIKGIVAI